jgi:hypothetical protein
MMLDHPGSMTVPGGDPRDRDRAGRVGRPTPWKGHHERSRRGRHVSDIKSGSHHENRRRPRAVVPIASTSGMPTSISVR